MKILIAAALLTIVSPAFAQSADPHAGHDKGESHEQHKDCCGDKDGNGKMDCCEKMKDGKAMACCEKHADKGDADAHAGHEKGKH